MGFGVMQAPLIDLTITSAPAFGVATSGGSVSAMPVRGSRGFRPSGAAPQPPLRSCAVVAGAARSGKTALVNALIRRPAEPMEAGDAWLVFRHGDRPEAWAYVPGHREPRPFPERSSVKGPVRPARRIEVTHPSPLLKRVTLIDTPGSGGLDAVSAEISLDAAADGLGLLFVVDAAAPLGRADLDLLGAAADRLQRIAFVLTRIDQHDEWPEVLAANRALLAALGPRLATAPWFPVSLAPASVFGVAELRHQLEAWAEEQGAADEEAAARTGGVAAATVSAVGDGWQEHLEREIRTRRLAAIERVSIDLATIHVRCVQELGSGKGCPELPRVLDRQLHALSVRSTRQLDADTRDVIGAVFGELLDTPPDAAVLARIAGAARRAVDAARDEGRERDRALLVTTTSGVAALTGAGALDSLSATGAAEPGDAGRVVSPLGIGLNAGSYAMWQARHAPGGPPKLPDKKDCRRWLQHALREIEVELGHELSERYAELRQALSIIAGDAVDHGVLLA
ncbi:GTPase domain-containing protein [Dactylosporangium matsuzakiense]|uniref:Dynamin family protein n=1 Tax=Dactylosporangium matsuzakiense TaxID=53360 RepID=A0A9W6NL44_9ACTN|nr:GTPase domain-containing protein [Dactylosporangium matsuzakiense]UWZ44042.1 hypothetical protein Dmats_42690 [Dactylosporangium matsuzakiense]GLL00733.1 hypothetical protein GCM10017581_024740 [Dactylosporangium matsuzakiense]